MKPNVNVLSTKPNIFIEIQICMSVIFLVSK